MGTPVRYPDRVSRSPQPLDEEQKKLLAAVIRAAKKATDAETEYKRLLAECAAADVPILQIAAALGVQRKTIYRHLGRPMA